MRNVSDTSCREKQTTPFMFNNIIFSWKSCRLWGYVAKYDKPR